MAAKLGNALRTVGVIAGFLMLNIALYAVSSWYGEPWAIAGLGWTLAFLPLWSFFPLGLVLLICYVVCEKIDPDPVVVAWRERKRQLRASKSQ